jgi:hypothetical protein
MASIEAKTSDKNINYGAAIAAAAIGFGTYEIFNWAIPGFFPFGKGISLLLGAVAAKGTYDIVKNKL